MCVYVCDLHMHELVLLLGEARTLSLVGREKKTFSLLVMFPSFAERGKKKSMQPGGLRFQTRRQWGRSEGARLSALN